MKIMKYALIVIFIVLHTAWGYHHHAWKCVMHRNRREFGSKIADALPPYANIFTATSYADTVPKSHYLHNLHRFGRKLLRKKLTIPLPKDEAWRFTKVNELFEGIRVGTPNRRSANFKKADLSNTSLAFLDVVGFIDDACLQSALVFVDGKFYQRLSTYNSSLFPLLRSYPSLQEVSLNIPEIKSYCNHFHANYTDYNEFPRDEYGSRALVGLNSVNVEDVCILHVPSNVSYEVPIQLIHIVTSPEINMIHDKGYNQTRSQYIKQLLILEDNAKITVKQSFVHVKNPTASVSNYINSVTQVVLGNSSQLSLTYFQNLSLLDRHTEAMFVTMPNHASCNSTFVLTGSKISRVNLHIDIQGEDAYCSVLGLTLSEKNQSLDLHSSIEHNAPKTTSKQLQRVLVGDQGVGIFKGRIRIPAIGQQTVSDQQCRSILFGTAPRAIVMPTLEVVAEDVEASHGAAMSDVDQNALLYMATRGISFKEARALLLEIFVLEMLENAVMDTKSRKALLAKLFAMNPDDEYDSQYADLWLGR